MMFRFHMLNHKLILFPRIMFSFLSDFELRSPENYSHHCDLIENEPYLSSRYSTNFGINHRSALNSLAFFDVSEGSLIPDITHDVLEGVLPLVLKLMINVKGNNEFCYCY